uniref:Uncharacterized protein n=1 Tax=viral metagenome TaxID=1070528 RepID=A0A6M3Y074_9ZZZZ
MKTEKEWHESKQWLSKYLEVGDEVDEDLADYFLGVLPPAYWENGVVQIGEPFDHDKNGKPRYQTIQQIDNHWYYKGICPLKSVVDYDVREV